VQYTDGSENNEGTSAGMYKWVSNKGHSFSLWLLTTVFQAEIHIIKKCIQENTKRVKKGGTSISSLIAKQPLRHLIISRYIPN
jgi:hypothetical protein